jgi:hypothetical protein
LNLQCCWVLSWCNWIYSVVESSLVLSLSLIVSSQRSIQSCVDFVLRILHNFSQQFIIQNSYHFWGKNCSGCKQICTICLGTVYCYRCIQNWSKNFLKIRDGKLSEDFYSYNALFLLNLWLMLYNLNTELCGRIEVKTEISKWVF